jgi:hypothetical protein
MVLWCNTTPGVTAWVTCLRLHPVNLVALHRQPFDSMCNGWMVEWCNGLFADTLRFRERRHGVKTGNCHAKTRAKQGAAAYAQSRGKLQSSFAD